MKLTKPINRLAIYMFYDEQGIVDDYVTWKLEKLREHVSFIYVVSNSKLTLESRKKLEAVADTVYVRENIGYDVWAYKEAIDRIGWPKLTSYDEVVFLNYTFFGPIVPFAEMFAKADATDCDFWGITAHGEDKGAHPRLPEHIQSHWIAVRARMLKSSEFRVYWDSMRVVTSYTESIEFHETRFTELFKNAGFQPWVYLDLKKFPSKHPLFDNVDLAIKARCPIIKRRTFFHDPGYLERFAVRLPDAIAAIGRVGYYPTELIWKNLARTTSLRTLLANIEAMQILPETQVLGDPAKVAKYKVAVLMHVFYPDMVEELLGYVARIPGAPDVYVTAPNEKTAKAIKAELTRLGEKVKEIRVAKEDRGRDMAPLVIGCRDVVLNGKYDLICRVHSKKSPQDGHNVGSLFKRHMFENLLASREYVLNIFQLFESQPSLGLVMPTTVHIGYPTLGHAWFGNKEGAQELAKKIGMTVSLDDETPVAPFGGMFWFRPAAMKKLFAHPFQYTDFNKEPDNKDGSLTHILERMFAYVAQDAGYLTQWVVTRQMAATNYVKLEYKYQRLSAEMPHGMLTDQVNWVRHVRRESMGWFWNRFHTTADYLINEYPAVVKPIRPIWKSGRSAVRKLTRR